MRYFKQALAVGVLLSVAGEAAAKEYAWADRTHDCTVLNALIEDSSGIKTSDWRDAPEAFKVRTTSCLVYPEVGSMVLGRAHPRILKLNFDCASKTEEASEFQVVEIFEEPAGIAEFPLETSGLTEQIIKMGYRRSLKLSADGMAQFRFPASIPEGEAGEWRALQATCIATD